MSLQESPEPESYESLGKQYLEKMESLQDNEERRSASNKYTNMFLALQDSQQAALDKQRTALLVGEISTGIGELVGWIAAIHNHNK